MTYSVRNSTRDDGLDDDTSTSSADDAESQARSVVDKIDYLYLGPFRVQLRKEKTRKW